MSTEHQAISALKWATIAKIVVQIASWAGTLVVVRLLTPEDYGLMAKVAVVCAIAGAIAELGLEAAIVRTANLARMDLRKIFGMSLILGASMTVALAAAAPLISYLFREPRLTWPIAAASLQIMVAAIALVPSAIWTRALSFRLLARVEMVSGVTAIGATLLLAFLGAGVWALVLGTLSGAIVRSAGLLVLGDRVWPLFSLRGMSDTLKFGLTLVGSRVSYIVVVQSDVLIGSIFLSTTEIGQYSVALQLATLPMTKFMGTINQIAFPAVAKQQGDPERVRQNMLKAIGVMSLVTFPTLWGISAVAPEFVLFLFGQKWLSVVPALAILPLMVPVRMVCSVMFTTSLALGNRQLDLRNTILNFVLLPSGFYIGAHWGLVGLCSAWLISVPLVYAFAVPPVLRMIGVRALQLAAECGPPATAAGIMYAAVATTRLGLEGQPAAAALFALSAAGACVYFAVIAIISRRHLATARSFARALFARNASSA